MPDPAPPTPPTHTADRDTAASNPPAIDADAGLIFATRLPGSPEDAERAWTFADLAAAPEGQPPIWVHLDRTRPAAAEWIRSGAGLDDVVADALLAEETRPRAAERDGGLLIILRGVHLNPGAEPDELIGIRLWVEPGRLISLRQHRFQTVRDLRLAAAQGKAPATAPALLAAIAEGLTLRLPPVVDNLADLLDDAEDTLIASSHERVNTAELADVRRQAIRLRRFLAPQRDALLALALSPAYTMLDADSRTELHEAAERTARVVEDLEEVRDRAAVTQEEVRTRREAQTNRTIYVLTLVAAIFLPLGLITGLLGINVGGMPGADDPWAFWIVTVGLTALAVLLVVVFRRLRWI